MSNLKENFETLVKFAKEHNFFEAFSQVYFVEEISIQYLSDSALHRIPRKFVFIFENYEKRFDELFNEGHSWINMYLAGIIDDSLLVIIETPNYENNVPREFVSVKFSLPTKRIKENNWKIAPFYEIVDM